MLYTYVAAYKILGLSRPTDAQETVISERPRTGIRALLTYDLDPYTCDVDRSSLVALMLLKGFIGQADSGTFEESLECELANLREQRRNQHGTGPFLIFEASGNIKTFTPRQERELDDFVIALEATPKEPIRERFAADVNGILSAFCLAADTVCGYQKIIDGVIFQNEQGKPVYSFTLSASGTGYVSRAVSNDVIDFVRKHSKKLSKSKYLTKVTRLLTQSMDTESDKLRSFLSAWAALEIFVNKNFKVYEERFLESFEGASGQKLSAKYLNRIRNVMRDKYRLHDKFLVLCSQLAPDSAEEDLKKFGNAKKVRDKLLHGDDVSENLLPVADVQTLVRKYLKQHVAAR